MKKFVMAFVAAALLLTACIAFSPPASARDDQKARVATTSRVQTTIETKRSVRDTGTEARRSIKLDARHRLNRSGPIERDAYRRLVEVPRE